jgi:hypothetical protein
MSRLTSIVASLTIITTMIPVMVSAQSEEQPFFDVAADSEFDQASKHLKRLGIVNGMDDGTLQPNKALTRAAATKIIFTEKMSEADLAVTSAKLDDASDQWFSPYVAWGLKKNVIDGKAQGKTNFNGADPVTKAAFIKMLTKAHGINTNVVKDIDASIAKDVADPEQWFYPYMRYGVYGSMIQLENDGNMQPGKQLNRGEAMNIMSYFLHFKDGKRATALAQQAQFELEKSSQLFNGDQGKNQETLYQAVFASVRARLSARGANDTLDNSSRSRAAVNITTAWHYILNGFLVVNYYTDYDKGLALAQEAWRLADESRTIDPGVEDLAQLVMNDASTLAAEIRKAQGGGS